MTGLYPTKTRLSLLDQVARGHIWQSNNHEIWDELRYKVTARALELVRAGWVEFDPWSEPSKVDATRTRSLSITDKGAAILAANGGAS